MIIGLGQLAPGPASSPNCGDSPCGAFDWIWVSTACQNYLMCADPTNPLVTVVAPPSASNPSGGGGLLNAAAGAAGSAVGSTASGLTTGVAAGIANATGIPVSALYIAMAAGAFFLLKDLIKK